MQSDWIPDDAMENFPWQIRARAAGLTQRKLARLLGHHERTVSSQLRGHWKSGVPRHVIAAIIVWEMLSPEDRERWLSAVDQEHSEGTSNQASDEKTEVSAESFRELQNQVRKLTKQLAKSQIRR